MSAEFRLGIQSYCFRNFQPLSALIDCLKRVGLHYVEIWPGHLDYKAGRTVARQGLDALKKAAITIDSYGVVGVDADEKKSRELFEFCKMAGLQSFSIGGVNDDAIDLVESLCDEFGINVAIHNHPKPSRYWNPDTVLAACKDRSKRLGSCADTGHWMRSGRICL